MALARLAHFLAKSPEERWVTVRYFFRYGLSRSPYFPLRTRFRATPSETVYFWWSYLPLGFCPDRTFGEYWGDDMGELRFLWRFLRPGDTFLDVGAHHGIYSILAAKRLAGHGRVLAFEPSPRERRRMDLHVRMNRLPIVSVEPYAIGSNNGREGLFVVVSDFTTMNSLRHPALEGAVERVPVETRRLDDYLGQKNLDRLDLLKVDIEGGELELFRGAEDCLQRLRPLVICEVLDRVTAPWGYRAHEIVSLLEAKGYAWFEFQDDGTLRTHQLQADYPEVRNYLAVPREKVHAVQPWVTP